MILTTTFGPRASSGRVLRRGRVASAVAGVIALGLAVGLVPASAAVAPAAPRRIVSGWIPYWNTTAGLATVVANSDLFGDVSPFWHSAVGNSPSISISNQASAATMANVVSTLHAQGIKVLPTVTDGSGPRDMTAQLSTSAGRTHMVTALVDLVVANSYDGIDLDWEGFAFNDGQASWTTTKPRWVAFISSLATALHSHKKLLAVSVPAGLGTNSDSTGYWVYAWTEIGPYVDRMRIMAYDYSVAHAGPIAPIAWVTNVVAHAITQVPASKIQIGIPAYGRDWYMSTSGLCPNVSPSSATSASFLSNLSWSTGRHSYSSSVAASYVSNLFVNAAATIPGITRVQAPVSTWDATAAERTFNYKVGFAGNYQSAAVTATPMGGLSGGLNVVVTSTVGIAVGDHVAGTGIGAGATVTAIGDHLLTLSIANTATVLGALTLTSSTVATATGVSGQVTVTVPVGTVARVGASASGVGIAAGAKVVSVDAPGTTVTLSLPNTADVTGNVTFATSASVAAVGGFTAGTAVRVASTTGVKVGASITGTGIAAGATVVSTTSSSITLSKANVGSVTTTLTATPAPVAASCTISRTGWYADGQSAALGARLVGTYHIAGVAEWTIGAEDPAQWAPMRAYARTIAPVATVVTLTTAAVATYGARTGIRAKALSGGLPVSGVLATLYFRKTGVTAWTKVVTGTTDATGVVNLAMTVVAPGQYLVTVPGTYLRLAASATQAVALRTAMVLTSNGPRVRHGAAVRVSAVLSPHIKGQKVMRQIRQTSGVWITMATAYADSTGHVAFAFTAGNVGVTRTYRLVAVGTTTVTGTTATFTITGI